MLSKVFLLLLGLTLSLSSKADDTYSFEYNVLTEHIFIRCDVAEKFKYRLTDCGRAITNPIFALKNEDTGVRYLLGENSIGEPIIGTTLTVDHLMVGFYLEQLSPFKHLSISKRSSIVIDDLMISPILGLEYELYYYEYKVYTIVTPLLLLFGIGYQF